MLYQTYQVQDDLVAPLRWAARWARAATGALRQRRRRRAALGAALEMISRFELTHASPRLRHRHASASATATCR